jgi:hypothetical protein
MNATPAGQPPRAREWKARFRRARRKHHERSLGDLLSDLYMLLWLLLVYGGALVSAVRRHLALAPAGTTAESLWITGGLFLTAAGIAWRGFGALGPLLATPAEQSWAVSTPLDRRRWLLPRLTSLLLAAGAMVAVMAVVAGMGLHGASLGWTTLAGGLFGITLAGASVAVQGRSREDCWSRRAGSVLIGAGLLTAVAVVVAHQSGWPLPSQGLPSSFALAIAGVPLACLTVVAAVRTLPGIDLAALSAGAQLAAATATATVGMDPSVLSGILEVRHWRRVGRVSSRPFRYGRLGRTWVLLQAEFRRQLRRPAVLGTWAALAVAQYAVALLVPAVAAVAHLVLLYFATNRLAAGLRTLSRSPGLRRALGGDELRVRLTHIVIPTLGAALWWLITWSASGAPHIPADLILIAGVSAASYRSATRSPLSYGGVVMETPFGLFPVEVVMQMARGPDLLGAMVVLQWIVAR